MIRKQALTDTHYLLVAVARIGKFCVSGKPEKLLYCHGLPDSVAEASTTCLDEIILV